MITKQKDPKLYATLERAAQDGVLAGITLATDTVRSALSLDPEQLTGRAMELGRTAQILPQGTIAPRYKAVYARRAARNWQSDVGRKMVRGLRLCPKVATWVKVTGAQLGELAVREGIYLGFQNLGNRMKNNGMDLRLLIGGFMWQLSDLVMAELEKRLSDPEVPRD